MNKPKQIKCQIRGCKNFACAWIKEKFVCEKHFYKIKNPPKKSGRWLEGI
jgi:hypothetical protein